MSDLQTIDSAVNAATNAWYRITSAQDKKKSNILKVAEQYASSDAQQWHPFKCKNKTCKTIAYTCNVITFP
jgi:hypothetical protein